MDITKNPPEHFRRVLLHPDVPDKVFLCVHGERVTGMQTGAEVARGQFFGREVATSITTRQGERYGATALVTPIEHQSITISQNVACDAL